ncbi:MAG: hypothetical protein JSV21_11825 [Nitrospirota bacterium]|nr:MAG: hypothetical protein JSV21_11825 [Nitrospirota bacterium]
MHIKKALISTLSLMVILAFFFGCSDSTPQKAERVPPKPPMRVQQPAVDQAEEAAEEETGFAPEENAIPEIQTAELVLMGSGGTGKENIIKANVTAIDEDEDDKPLIEYQWFKNDDPVGTGDTIGGFKRGDRIRVRLRAFDGKAYSEERFMEFAIDNTAPQIDEIGSGKFDGNIYSYQIKASDPDGDPLDYELSSGPEGMDVDSNGLINWEVPEDFSGDVSATVMINDGNRGLTKFDFTVTVTGQPEPAPEAEQEATDQ